MTTDSPKKPTRRSNAVRDKDVSRRRCYLTKEHANLLRSAQHYFTLVLGAEPSETLLIRRGIELLAVRAMETKHDAELLYIEKKALMVARCGTTAEPAQITDEERAGIVAGLEAYLDRRFPK